MKKVYMASFYKFGYDLEVIATTRQKAVESLVAEYIRAYVEINGIHPGDDMYDEDTSYLAYAEEDIEVREYELGKVEWR